MDGEVPSHVHAANLPCSYLYQSAPSGGWRLQWRNENSIPSVEIVNTDTQQWYTAATNYPLWNCERIATSVSSSIATCGDNIYVFEGDDRTLSHVYTCSLSSLLQSCMSAKQCTHQWHFCQQSSFAAAHAESCFQPRCSMPCAMPCHSFR